jgi:protoporphyrin/coproporphyrin ferrochelatase
MARTGVLLQGYGGPKTVADVGPFMLNLTGRAPSPELLARIESHYEAIGGGSPLLGIAEGIAAALEERLTARGFDIPVRVGMRYWEPYIADTVAELVALGCDRIVALSLSAFESEIATGAYRKAIEPVLAEHPCAHVVEAPLAAVHDAYAEFFARSVREALAHVPAGAIVAFSAHSLPLSDLVADDPYVSGIEATAAKVAELLGLGAAHTRAGSRFGEGFATLGSDEGPNPWYLVYQSKGARPGAWLGPDLDVLLDGAVALGEPGVVVCPIGFMTDHMETLWDLDIVAAKHAGELGIPFARAAVPNVDGALLDVLADSVAALA